MSSKNNHASVPPLPPLIGKLLASRSACDQRKGRDLQLLVEACHGVWRDRLVPVGTGTTANGTVLLLGFDLRVAGLAWLNGTVVPQGQFRLLLALPEFYPISMAMVTFPGPEKPFNPHIFDSRHKLPAHGAPPEYQEFLKHGDGAMCYARPQQWAPDLVHDLIFLTHAVSRVVSGNLFFGEAAALNGAARDHYLRLQRQNALPFGPALPLPEGAPLFHGDDSDDDIELIEESRP